jgi:phosphate transport system substrate-binding protein
MGFAISGVLFLICLFCIWNPFQKKRRGIAAVSLTAALALAAGAVLGIQSYRGGIPEIPDGDGEIDLLQYMPFGEGTLAARVDGTSELKLTEDLPRIDGATALYPLYAAFVMAVYPDGDYNPSYALEYEEYAMDPEEYALKYPESPQPGPVACSRTDGAFENLINGRAEIAFLMDISDEQREMAEEKGLTLRLTPIGREAFVFFVNSRNGISGLRQDEIRAIYSGELTNWREAGDGSVGGSIEAYQRPEGSGSQTALLKLMDGAPIIEPKARQVQALMGGMYEVVADYKNYRNALGYSFRFYIETMLNDAELQKVRLLEVDGVAPTAANIADGSYPLSGAFYAVTAAPGPDGYAGDEQRLRAENAEKLIAWILSPQGQGLVEKTGYVPLPAGR